MSKIGVSIVEFEPPVSIEEDSLQLEFFKDQPWSSGLELNESWILPPPEIPNNLGDSPWRLEENCTCKRRDLCVFQSTTERSIHLPERFTKPGIGLFVSASITVQLRWASSGTTASKYTGEYLPSSICSSAFELHPKERVVKFAPLVPGIIMSSKNQ